MFNKTTFKSALSHGKKMWYETEAKRNSLLSLAEEYKIRIYHCSLYSPMSGNTRGYIQLAHYAEKDNL